VYIRYRSYESEEEMTADIKKMNPYKIDIGAVFSAKVKLDAHALPLQIHLRCIHAVYVCVQRAHTVRTAHLL
jgi:hypothetical protein